MSEGKRFWAQRVAWLAALLCFGSVAASLVGAVGAGQGVWTFGLGFTVLRYAFFVAIAGALTALVGLWLTRSGKRSILLVNVMALVVAVGFLAFVGNQVRIARSVPPIHDITTDLLDPPDFRRLAIRADNLESVPAGDRADLELLAPVERWRALHREHYGDLEPVRVPWTVAETIERAQALAVVEGWEIAFADPAAGIMEATDTSLFFRFKDDIAVRVRPAPGGGAIIDMRSISRVGISDVGVNARRVRAFLAELQRS